MGAQIVRFYALIYTHAIFLNGMIYVFTVLFLFSLIALPIGLIKPSLIFRSGSSRKKAGAVLGGLTALFFVLIGVTAPPSEKRIASTSVTASPSGALQEPTITPTEAVTSSPASSHNGVMVKVVNVVDGDTIKVETGETIRYIGIDTPETVDPRKPVMCYGKEASDKNTELVEGKVVELEKDISEKDKYGRLLRYIWLDDVLVNEVLVREGYAQSSTYPPDVKYQDRFVEAQRLAREEQKGLWGSTCTITSTPKPISKPTQSTIQGDGTQPGEDNGTYVCNCSKTCSQMSSCTEAQYQLNVCGCSKRDADKDGIACDSDCQ
jgi:micrococcal nuclease